MALIWLAPKAKLVWWSPHQFLFSIQMPPQTEGGTPWNALLRTHAITIQNQGRQPAHNIEIIHQRKPDLFQLSPSLDFRESFSPQGSHIVRVDALGPREFFTIEFLSYTSDPGLQVIRSNEGTAQPITVQFNRVLPRRSFYLGWALILTGACYWLYWLI